MPFQNRFVALIFLLVLLKINGLAQPLKSPDEFLPHGWAKEFTPHFQLVRYFETVAAASPKTVRLLQFGMTNEDRPQLLAIVSSPENMARLDELKRQHLAEINGEKTASDQPPVVFVWLGYSVHGNEPAGSEASMKVLFDLASQTRADIRDWLKNVVVFIDPSQNPDGFDRFSHWIRMVSNRWPQPNAASREHQEAWPSGRVNHYQFDLNRDWAWQTQVESQNRVRVFQEWLPQIHADLHEMGYQNPYFFPPVAEPTHEIITPFQRQFQLDLGKNHARYFDEKGWLFFTREEYDLLYPSYGDSYPTYNGAIGLTYEQGGIRAARAIFMENGDTLTLLDRALHHCTTSLSTIEMASKNAARLVENFKKYFADARSNPRGSWKSFVLRATDDRLQNLNALTQLLDKHHIMYGQAGKVSAQRGFNYASGREENVEIQPNDIIVSCFQTHSDLAVALLEPEPKLNDSVTYDITAWSLPLAYGLDAFALKTRLEPTEKRPICSFLPLAPSPEAVAYVVRWTDFTSSRFLSEAWKNGLRVRRSSAPFQIGEQHFGAGSLILTRADNADLGRKFDEIVSQASLVSQAQLLAAKSGFMQNGQDFGSGGLVLLRKPTVALVYSDDCDVTSFGHVWWHFEQELEFPIATISQKLVENGKLDGFNLLILPEGISLEKMDGLKVWLEKGGRVISIGEAVKNFADKDGFNLKTKFADDKKKEENEKKELKSPLPFAQKDRDALSDAIFGTVVKNSIDTTHPLGFGLGDHYFSLKTSADSFDFMKNGTVAWIPETVESYGFIGSRARPKIKNSLTVGVDEIGRGSVVYLIDPPLFRGFWQQGKLLFDNVVFF